MRFAIFFVGIVAGFVSDIGSAAQETPQAILDHARSVYTEMTSYSDTGRVLREYSPTSREERHFATFFNRAPRHFLFDFHKQSGDRIVVWGDTDAFHAWWKATGQTTEYPNPKNTGAISLNDYPTDSVITKVPTLLYSKAGLSGALKNFNPAGVAASEPVGGQPCYRLGGTTSDVYAQSGKTVNVRKLTVWIDSKTYLLRQVLEEAPAAPGMLDRVTTTYEPQANPAIKDDSFSFKPPK